MWYNVAILLIVIFGIINMKKLFMGLFMFGFLFVISSQVCAMGQDYSTSHITVLSPNGGEVYESGQKIEVKWSSVEISDNSNVLIRLADVDSDGFITSQYQDLISSTPNDGKEFISLPAIVGKAYYRIQVRQINTETSDFSDNFFTVSSDVSTSKITILSPNGGEVYKAGDKITITWNSKDTFEKQVVIGLVDSSGVSYMITPDNIYDSGSYTWTIPSKLSVGGEGGMSDLSFGKNFKIVMSDDGSPRAYDISDNLFTINSATTTPLITVLSPNGGESYNAGDKFTIRWKTENIPSNASIYILIDDGRIGGEYTSIPVNNTGSYIFDLQGYNTGKKFKVFATYIGSSPYTIDSSDSNFTINSATTIPSITVVSPKGGEIYTAGQKVTIKWTSSNVENVEISMAQGGHDMGHLSENSIPASLGSFQWTVPNVSNMEGDKNNFIIGIWDADPGHFDVVGKSGLFTINSVNNVCANGATNYPTCTIRNTLPVDCTSTSGYSSMTGAKCDGYINNEGCKLGYKFSSTTGRACVTIIVPKTCSSTGVGCRNNVTPNPTSTSSARTLKRGIIGDDVKILQQFLNLAADGSFGPQTQTKVMEWQRNNGLTPDGVFGAMSRQKAGL